MVRGNVLIIQPATICLINMHKYKCTFLNKVAQNLAYISVKLTLKQETVPEVAERRPRRFDFCQLSSEGHPMVVDEIADLAARQSADSVDCTAVVAGFLTIRAADELVRCFERNQVVNTDQGLLVE